MTNVSAYAPQAGLCDEVKDKMLNTLLLAVSEMGEQETVVQRGDLNGHVGEYALVYEGVYMVVRVLGHSKPD